MHCCACKSCCCVSWKFSEFCRALRLVPSPPPAPRQHIAADRRQAAVISGGTRGLGLQFAGQAAAAGQGTLVLMSRKPSVGRKQLAALARQGAAVFVVRCDAGSPGATAAVQRWAAERLPAVQTYAHAAGALGYDLIPDVTAQSFLDVTRAKVWFKTRDKFAHCRFCKASARTLHMHCALRAPVTIHMLRLAPLTCL